MHLRSHIKLVSLVLLLILGSSSYAYSLIGRPLNYYYELQYDNNNNATLAKKKQLKQWFVSVGNTTSKYIPKHKSKKKILKNLENKAPLTFEDYLSMTQDVKRNDIKLQEPTYAKDTKIIELPEPNLRIVKYNNPPGTPDINLNDLFSTNKVNSVGVLSPDQSKLVYSVANYCPSQNFVSSEMYSINLEKYNSIKAKLKNANIIQRDRQPLLAAGVMDLTYNQFKTLVLIDWSKDGKRLAVKEKVGSLKDGIWQTNLIVYDFETKQQLKLNAVREAIRYWWKTNKNLDLVDYIWDIFPVGWDANSPDRIILYAYAYTSKTPQFLGTWSIDYKGNRSELLSIDKTNFPIESNGLSLKMVVRE